MIKETGKVTEGQATELYRQAFDHICDPSDWKGPINCLVPLSLFKVYSDAITFMTGTVANANIEGDMVRLTSCGYRAGPCGDH